MCWWIQKWCALEEAPTKNQTKRESYSKDFLFSRPLMYRCCWCSETMMMMPDSRSKKDDDDGLLLLLLLLLLVVVVVYVVYSTRKASLINRFELEKTRFCSRSFKRSAGLDDRLWKKKKTNNANTNTKKRSADQSSLGKRRRSRTSASFLATCSSNSACGPYPSAAQTGVHIIV